ERRNPPDVVPQARTVDGQRVVLAPLDRMPDLRGEGVELRERFLPGGLAHPVESVDRVAVRLDEVADQLVHPGAGGRRVVPVDIDLADRLAHRPLDEPDTTLPPVAELGGPAQRTSVEVEVLFDECG